MVRTPLRDWSGRLPEPASRTPAGSFRWRPNWVACCQGVHCAGAAPFPSPTGNSCRPVWADRHSQRGAAPANRVSRLISRLARVLRHPERVFRRPGGPGSIAGSVHQLPGCPASRIHPAVECPIMQTYSVMLGTAPSAPSAGSPLRPVAASRCGAGPPNHGRQRLNADCRWWPVVCGAPADRSPDPGCPPVGVPR